MQPFEWVAPLKEAVLVLFFLAFCGVLGWMWSWPEAQLQALQPLQDGEA